MKKSEIQAIYRNIYTNYTLQPPKPIIRKCSKLEIFLTSIWNRIKYVPYRDWRKRKLLQNPEIKKSIRKQVDQIATLIWNNPFAQISTSK